MANTTKLGDHAVVLGASMAGLLAGCILADFYARVTVIERDVLVDEPVGRRGVPQGRHVHVLLGRGSHILGALFPGLLDELVADGACVWNDGDLSKLYLSLGGHELVRAATVRDRRALTMYMASRPFLECHVRRRLRSLPNVSVHDGHDVTGFMSTSDRRRITGVRAVQRGTGAEQSIIADLVLDASGRGSRTPTFLVGLGYGRPPEDEVMVHVAYASQLLRMPAGAVAEKMVLVGATPDRPTLMALVGYEGDSWMLTVGGIMGRQPPLDRYGMLQFGEDMIPPHLMPALRAATPIGEAVGYRVPSNRWRRYDKMARLPEGLLVSGDAICSFNPVYGQGMTVAALDALALRRCLQHGVDGLPSRFFSASAKAIGVAWQTATGSDLSIPAVPGRRTLSMRAVNAYTDRVLAAAETDPLVCEQFLRAMQFIDPPTRLFAPRMLAGATMARPRARMPKHTSRIPVGQ